MHDGIEAIQVEDQQVYDDGHQTDNDNEVYLNEEDLCGEDDFNTLPFIEGLPKGNQLVTKGADQQLHKGN